LNGTPWLLADVSATAESVAWVARQHGWFSTDDVAEGPRVPHLRRRCTASLAR
jgi:hypothetical protein